MTIELPNLEAEELELLDAVAVAATRHLGLDTKLEAFRKSLPPDIRETYRRIEDEVCQETALIQLISYEAGRRNAFASVKLRAD